MSDSPNPTPTPSVPAELVMLSIQDMMDILGVRQTTLYYMRQQPGFPKPLRLCATLAWRAVDVMRWLEKRSRQAGNPPVKADTLDAALMRAQQRRHGQQQQS